MWPWLSIDYIRPVPHIDVDELGEPDDFADPEPPRQAEPDLAFDQMMPQPGVLHVTHNIGAGVVKSMKFADKAVDKLKVVVKFITTEFTRNRFIELCVNDPAGRVLQKDLKQLKCKVHKNKWGTVVFASSQLL